MEDPRKSVRSTRRMWCLMIIGIAVHVFMLYSVFDIYFVSPVFHGMTPHKSGGQPPAKRVVLFVADGLRAASMYGDQMELLTPYLWNQTKTGSMGISHTQVPTESRPGHVALLAGFNEDPSAITKGWKTNPVDFDSVINQSRNAWCWGSPDIVDIFNKDNLSHIHLHSYDAYMQDFSGKNSPSILDNWVFDQVDKLFELQENRTCTDLCERGNIYFLHLLGLDTAGHSFKPTSRRYIKSITVVDAGIKDAVANFEDYFYDKKTAYIFTSDHGMTDWGSHGDGSRHETQVPFIAWGAGISHNPERQDIAQIDIAPLISSLIGINIPINSIGAVPLSYIRATPVQKARIMFSNALQLSEQYIVKHNNVKTSVSNITFQEYRPLPLDLLHNNILRIRTMLENRDNDDVINDSQSLINLCKMGLKYYYTYYQKLLLALITVGFVGWIVYLFISINHLHTSQYKTTERKTPKKCGYKLLTLIPYALYIVVSVVMLVITQAMPHEYYIYCGFPLITWFAVVINCKHVLVTFSLIRKIPCLTLLKLIVGYAVGIELLFATFFDPVYLCPLFLYVIYQCLFRQKIHGNKYDIALRTVIVVVLGTSPITFTLQTDFGLISLAMSMWLWKVIIQKWSKKSLQRRDRNVLKIQLYVLELAFINNLCVNLTIYLGFGLLLINQVLSWFLLCTFPIFPLLISRSLEKKVISAVIALMVPYTLMAVGFEHLFMYGFAQLAVSWMSLEFFNKYHHPFLPIYQILPAKNIKNFTDQQSVRRCFYLLIFIMAGYFGVGNTPRMNSFDPLWVSSFVTVFSPYTMAILILIKLAIPFLIVLCVFRGIMIFTKCQLLNCFLIILFFCDVMLIQFLYYVKNEGSWLEIGVSLSRYIVASVTTIVLIVLYQIANILTTVSCEGLIRYLPFRDFVEKRPKRY